MYEGENICELGCGPLGQPTVPRLRRGGKGPGGRPRVPAWTAALGADRQDVAG